MDMPNFFNELFSTAFTPRQVVAGYSRAGVWPYDPNCMQEKVAKSSLVTTSSDQSTDGFEVIRNDCLEKKHAYIHDIFFSSDISSVTQSRALPSTNHNIHVVTIDSSHNSTSRPFDHDQASVRLPVDQNQIRPNDCFHGSLAKNSMNSSSNRSDDLLLIPIDTRYSFCLLS